jgi:hypothetical protein
MATMTDHGGRPPVPPGEIRVEHQPAGRLLVEIGRASKAGTGYSKRLNLSRAEARGLATELLTALGPLGDET